MLHAEKLRGPGIRSHMCNVDHYATFKQKMATKQGYHSVLHLSQSCLIATRLWTKWIVLHSTISIWTVHSWSLVTIESCPNLSDVCCTLLAGRSLYGLSMHYITHMTSDTRPSCFSACKVEKLRRAWGRRLARRALCNKFWTLRIGQNSRVVCTTWWSWRCIVIGNRRHKHLTFKSSWFCRPLSLE